MDINGTCFAFSKKFSQPLAEVMESRILLSASPAPLARADIGAHPHGSSSFAAGTFTITGAGAGFAGASDAGGFVYEPLTNRRQHYMLDDYKDSFEGVTKLYWIPSYLAREDPTQRVISPSELIGHLSDPSIAVACERDAKLKQVIQKYLDSGAMVVGMAGGGGDSLDDWLRFEFKN